MSVQIINTKDGGRLAVLPEPDYLALVEAAETLVDIGAIDRFKARLAAGEEELLPASLVNAILDGANPLRAWREHRGLTVSALAASAGVSAAYVSQIESGKREGTIDTLRKIATALNVMIDDIVVAPEPVLNAGVTNAS